MIARRGQTTTSNRRTAMTGRSGGRTIRRPRLATARRFLHTEAGGAIVMLGAAIIALAWANSPWRDSYVGLWATELSIELGPFHLGHDLGHWVNDGLMTLFFLLIGLEIRREFDLGELRDRRRVGVPVIAAIGGMVVPAALFLLLNPDPETARGWAMVMATDTAFALGILAIAGRQAPLRLRVFLLTLMIVDDVGAVSVIAIAYSTDVQVLALAIALAGLVGMVLARRLGVQRTSVYWLIGLVIWVATMEAGVHPTVAGVAIGLLTSAYPPRREELQAATGLTRAFREQPTAELASEAARRITLSLSPNDRLQHALHPWTSFVVVPVFALANAGIALTPEAIDGALRSPITWGVVAGLVVGKIVGISLGAWIATRPWAGSLPMAVGWPAIFKLSTVAGVGFTVSLLIAELSYTGELLEQAKLGIFGASILAATVSIVVFRVVHALPAEWLRRAEAGAAPPVADLVVPVDLAVDHVRGAREAPVTLVEYGDFECPYCRAAAPTIEELLERYPGRLRFVFRHLPLVDVHPNAALAAEAAEAAGAQGRFWEMHDTLYRNQDALGVSDLIGYARNLGLDADAFEADLRSGRFSRRVARDVSGAELSGVAGTPTFFINDLRHRGRYDIDAFDRAIRSTLRLIESPEGPAAEATEPA
jgi:Na+/H+ antiporter NhaA